MTVERLRIVIFREGEYWLAQGLENDLGAQAANLKDLLMRLETLLAAERHTSENAVASPKYFQDLWTYRAGGFTPVGAYAVGTDLALEFGMVA